MPDNCHATICGIEVGCCVTSDQLVADVVCHIDLGFRNEPERPTSRSGEDDTMEVDLPTSNQLDGEADWTLDQSGGLGPVRPVDLYQSGEKDDQEGQSVRKGRLVGEEAYCTFHDYRCLARERRLAEHAGVYVDVLGKRRLDDELMCG